MSRSTLILSAAGGALATLAIQGASAEPLDAAELIAELAALASVCSGAASFAWFWPKSRLEVRTAESVEAIRRRRHRGDRAPLRPGARPAGVVFDELAQWQTSPAVDEQPAAPVAGDMGQRPAVPAGQSTPIVQPPAAERPRPLDTTAADWPIPPATDPYLTPANLDADGYPEMPFRTAEDATRDLAGLGNAQMIPAHREPADGWEQLREPAATRSADDLLWYSPAGPA